MNAIYHLKGNKSGAQAVIITVGTCRDGYKQVTQDHDVREDGARISGRFYNEFSLEDAKIEFVLLKATGYTVSKGVDIVIK